MSVHYYYSCTGKLLYLLLYNFYGYAISIESKLNLTSELKFRILKFMFSDQDGHVHRINLDLTGFKPEDVKVTLKDRVVSLGMPVLLLGVTRMQH